MNEIDILTVEEVAELLKVSKGLVLNAIKGKLKETPRLAAIKIGRRKLVSRKALEKWLELCGASGCRFTGDLHEESTSTGLRNQITQ